MNRREMERRIKALEADNRRLGYLLNEAGLTFSEYLWFSFYGHDGFHPDQKFYSTGRGEHLLDKVQALLDCLGLKWIHRPGEWVLEKVENDEEAPGE